MALPLPYWKEKTYRKTGTEAPPGHIINSQNLWERAACEKLWKEGWKVYRRGWPDFIAIKGNEIQFIEVKPPVGSKRRPCWLDPDQERIAAILRRFYGIRVKVWNRYDQFGLEEIRGPVMEQFRNPPKKKIKIGYGEHLIKSHLPNRKSLTETLPAQG